jgi:hypothetical protein
MVKSKKKTPWQIAKPLLEEDILSGEIPDSWEAEVIVQKRVEYDDVPIKNFKVNLKNLRLRINIDKTRAVRDAASLKYDSIIQRNRNMESSGSDRLRWDGSMAQELLKDLVKNNKHVGRTPRDIRNEYITEFGQFSLKKFRSHLHQEISASTQSLFWLAKKDKKLKNKPPTPTGESAGAATLGTGQTGLVFDDSIFYGENREDDHEDGATDGEDAGNTDAEDSS